MSRKTVDDLLAEARRRIAPRLRPEETLEAMRRGTLLVDLRSVDERRRHGIVPGSLHIPRSVLEWRVDPESGSTNPAVGGFDRELVLFCAEGYSSSLAAASLQELGFSRATDLVGGFTAWKEAGLPVRAASESDSFADGELPGMRPPDSLDPDVADRANG